MNTVKNLAGVAAILAALLLAVTLAVSVWLQSRAELVQRVTPHDEATATLLDEVGTLVGREDRYIILDRGAFLGETTVRDAQYVSEPYLKENNVYPLQLKTVTFFRNLIVAVSLGAFVLFGGVWLGLRRRGRRATPVNA